MADVVVSEGGLVLTARINTLDEWSHLEVDRWLREVARRSNRAMFAYTRMMWTPFDMLQARRMHIENLRRVAVDGHRFFD